ncbi:MAG: DNA mismatch repair protein MutS [Methanomicrobiaceae archaeon]|nr:DNA mismatch repair protein MutS [Methanomicrobiaceae archaeon]
MKNGPTPAMQQFYAMKERHPDAIIFFQMGDFFETFGEDAEVVARELDITLTSRGRNRDGERMPLAGVPVHAGESYIARLVAKGYRVAVCEQVEDPKKAKGVVKRDIVRVVTPGTVIDSGMLTANGPSYLMGIAPDSKHRVYGLAFLDISTGEFFVASSEADDAGQDLLSWVARYRPTECIVPPDLSGKIKKRLEDRGVVVTDGGYEAFDSGRTIPLLCEQFGVASLEGFGCAEMPESVAAAGACLWYAKETQKAGLAHINGMSVRHEDTSMVLDAITLRNLEIIESIRKGDSSSTLIELLDDARTAMGSRTLRSWVTAPLVAKTAIEERLDAVDFFIRNPVDRADLRALLHRFADIERIAGRISYGNAGPRDLVTLRTSLERVPPIRELLERHGNALPARIAGAAAGIMPMTETADLIRRAVVDEPPLLARSGGVIREGYDEHLDELHRTATTGKTWIAEFQQQERDRTGIKSLKVGYNRIFGYYIEVTRSNVRLVPPEYQRKQTTANGERYTLPVLQEKEAVISHAEERQSAVEADLYAALIVRLREHVADMQETARSLGLLDSYAALAEVAASGGYTRPVISETEELTIREGRHPVVERGLERGFVPNDTDLDSGADQILIITGANMAGKSTYMRAVALICIMAQMGSYVPATHATIGIIDRIFTRVGAFDDLASGQSTFMVEMLELANILNNVSRKSLVILDEIGRGTSTLDGFSIARSVLEFLHGKGAAGPRTLFATHFHELVEVEADLKRVRNYHFAVKDTGTEVAFLRKLIPGATDRSYGIHVARLAGIPNRVTDRADEILGDMLRRSPAPEGKRAPRYTQMLLVSTPEISTTDHRVIADLQGADLDALTPKDALLLLYDLQKKARGER